VLLNNSVWKNTCEIRKRKGLNKNITADAVVIGGGMAGILIAERLSSEGKRAVVLEAKQIAGGQTQNTTAKITAQHGMIYSNLISQLKEKGAEEYAKANMRAVEWYRTTVESRNIDCSFENKDAYVYSECESRLRNEYNACKRLNLPVEYITNPQIPYESKGAVQMKFQAQFNPLPFIKELSENLEIYENTPVITVKDNTVFCHEANVEATDIIFACHYPFINFPGLYFARMYQQRSYVLALKNTPYIEGMYICAGEIGFSFRMAGELLLLGGGQHRAGENIYGGKYDILYDAAQKMFPKSSVVARWSAQDCITADGIPYIGRYSQSKPHWYVATGFGKWGMTTSCVAAEIITDLIMGRKNSAEEIFSPARCSLCSAKGTVNEVLHSAKGLIKQVVHIPNNKLEDISVGSGGSVFYQGKRVGIYRESADKYYAVSLRCPHLGCRLEWNQDEKSWDCPCHGSRFDYKGRLIDNPAQNDLKVFEI